MSNEPIIIGLTPAIVTGLISSVATFGKSFGFWDLSDDQVNAINDLAVKLMTVLAIVGVWVARKFATPAKSPTVVSGTTVTVTDEQGNTTGAVQV